MTEITKGAKAFLEYDLKRTAYGCTHGDFTSSATGTQKWYSANHEVQLEMLFAYVGGISISLQCGDVEDGPKAFIMHDTKQMAMVIRDLLSKKYATGVQLATLCETLHDAKTQEEVDAIKWSPI